MSDTRDRAADTLRDYWQCGGTSAGKVIDAITEHVLAVFKEQTRFHSVNEMLANIAAKGEPEATRVVGMPNRRDLFDLLAPHFTDSATPSELAHKIIGICAQARTTALERFASAVPEATRVVGVPDEQELAQALAEAKAGGHHGRAARIAITLMKQARTTALEDELKKLVEARHVEALGAAHTAWVNSPNSVLHPEALARAVCAYRDRLLGEES